MELVITALLICITIISCFVLHIKLQEKKLDKEKLSSEEALKALLLNSIAQLEERLNEQVQARAEGISWTTNEKLLELKETLKPIPGNIQDILRTVDSHSSEIQTMKLQMSTRR